MGLIPSTIAPTPTAPTRTAPAVPRPAGLPSDSRTPAAKTMIRTPAAMSAARNQPLPGEPGTASSLTNARVASIRPPAKGANRNQL
jgi:hypothetical protein